MDRVAILCNKSRDLMHEYSRRSLDRVSGHSFVFASRSLFSTYVDANVKKEIEKDRLIIRVAAGAFHAAREARDLDLEDIFEKTKRVDKEFLDTLLIPSFTLSLRYSDFSDIRIQRIWRISTMVYALLRNWPDGASLADAVRNAYTEKEFREHVAEILHLYNVETRVLSKSIRRFTPFSKAITAHLESLFQAMEETKDDITDRYTKRIFSNTMVFA
jgi:hypothetical protein